VHRLPSIARLLIAAAVLAPWAASGALAQVANCPPLTGRWAWFVGGMVTFAADGTGVWKAYPEASKSLTVTWTCQPATGVFTLTWQQGLIDTVTMSEDGRTLTGQNQYGVAVRGEVDDDQPSQASGSPSAIDPTLVGSWRLEIELPSPQGPVPVNWDMRADGTYAVDAGPFSHAGTLEAKDGQWHLQSTVNSFTDGGRYEMPDWTTLVTYGTLGVGRWYREAPKLVLETATIGGDTIPKNLPELAHAATALARSWQADAILVMLEAKPPAGALGYQANLTFFSPATGGGLWLTASRDGARLRAIRAGGGGVRIPDGFLDLPEAWAIARQHGVPPPIGPATLRVWQPKDQDPVLLWSLRSARGNTSGAQIDGATGIAFEGDPSGYIEDYNQQWTQAVAGLRRLLARPTHHHRFASASGSEGSSSSGSDEADAGTTDDWDFNTAAQNAWEDGNMDSYDRIIGGEGTDEDKSRYGDY
jgi:hypothetical protein